MLLLPQSLLMCHRTGRGTEDDAPVIGARKAVWQTAVYPLPLALKVLPPLPSRGEDLGIVKSQAPPHISRTGAKLFR